jgi:hypothetical protein
MKLEKNKLNLQGEKFTIRVKNGLCHMPIGLNKVKAKCNLYEGECFIVVKVASSFKCYFYGSPFPLVMYHQPLNFFMEFN